MLINWFTVFAQAINFLILVWLLKQFLYKPVLHAIDERRKGSLASLPKPRQKWPTRKRSATTFSTRTRPSIKSVRRS